ncbi:MAG: hypothetical protein HYU05_00235, partial [Candidatus Wildermuthbacteria bacterium]|nr:hypothetical protein [Candidatus Wildermuthbacteria bacterium]
HRGDRGAAQGVAAGNEVILPGNILVGRVKEVGEKEGYDFHVFGPETSMSESARIVVELSYEHSC